MNWTARTQVLVGVVALIVATTSVPAEAVDLGAHPWIGEPAPAFELPEVDGGTLALEKLRGTFIVIHFGTSW